MTQVQREKRDHIQCIDLMRTLAILTVMATHLSRSGHAYHVGIPWVDTAWRLFENNGSYGVSMFFVISGYLITRMLAQQPEGLFTPVLRNFYVRRAGRLWPLLAVLVVVGAAAIWGMGQPNPANNFCYHHPRALFDPWFWVSIPTFTFNWLRIARESISGSYGLVWDVQWSLAVEEQFYLLYPLLLRWARNEKRLFRILVVVILAGIFYRLGAWYVAPRNFLATFTASPACFDQIAMGCLLYFISERARPYLDEQRAVAGLTCLMGLLLVGGIYVGWSLSDTPTRVLGPSFIGLGVFLFLLGGMSLPWFDSRWWRPFTLPGRLSYGCYLLHGVSLWLLWSYFPGKHKLWAFSMYVVGTTALAYVSFKLLEEPAARFIRARFAVRSPARPAADAP